MKSVWKYYANVGIGLSCLTKQKLTEYTSVSIVEGENSFLMEKPSEIATGFEEAAHAEMEGK